MTLYRIKNWNSLFENNRSRTVADLAWVAIPNRHDGENYSMIITSKHGAEIFAAWVLMVQVASRCHPRGSLLRDSGKPHNPDSLSIKTRAPAIWFERAISFLLEHTDWLEIEELASACQPPVSRVSVACQAGDEERKKEGMEGTEGNGTELKEPSLSGKPDGGQVLEVVKSGKYHSDSRAALHILNESSGRHFRETDANLSIISARFNEGGVTLEGIRTMIVRQCAKWRDTEFADYLQPSTLFSKSKFDGYYASKDSAIMVKGQTGKVTKSAEDRLCDDLDRMIK